MSAAVLQASAYLAAGCLLVALPLAHPIAAFAGFAAFGFGIANVVPSCFVRQPLRRPNVPSAALAAVTTTGYPGFVSGPPSIDVVAGATDLSVGLTVVMLACLAIADSGARVMRTGEKKLLPVETA